MGSRLVWAAKVDSAFLKSRRKLNFLSAWLHELGHCSLPILLSPLLLYPQLSWVSESPNIYTHIYIYPHGSSFLLTALIQRAEKGDPTGRAKQESCQGKPNQGSSIKTFMKDRMKIYLMISFPSEHYEKEIVLLKSSNLNLAQQTFIVCRLWDTYYFATKTKIELNF